MRKYASLAAVSAIALLAAETGSGSGSATIAPLDGPTPDELKAAEEARAQAVADLAKIKDETASTIAEAEKATKAADAEKAKATKAKDAAEAAKSDATKAKEAAEAEARAADNAKADAKRAQGELAQAKADLAQAKADLARAQAAAQAGEPTPEAEPQAGPRQAIVWAAPGHALLAVGMLVSVPADEAEALRARGRARFASDEEIEAAGDDIPQLSSL